MLRTQGLVLRLLRKHKAHSFLLQRLTPYRCLTCVMAPRAADPETRISLNFGKRFRKCYRVRRKIRLEKYLNKDFRPQDRSRQPHPPGLKKKHRARKYPNIFSANCLKCRIQTLQNKTHIRISTPHPLSRKLAPRCADLPIHFLQHLPSALRFQTRDPLLRM